MGDKVASWNEIMWKYMFIYDHCTKKSNIPKKMYKVDTLLINYLLPFEGKVCIYIWHTFTVKK